MSHDFSYINLFFEASYFVKAIMLILIALSVYSLGLSLWKTKVLTYKRLNLSKRKMFFNDNVKFEVIYKKLLNKPNKKSDIENIFLSGFDLFYDENIELNQKLKHRKLTIDDINNLNAKLDHYHEKMYLKIEEYEKSCHKYLSNLATIGSVAPYIGLLGTVVGIIQVMHSFGIMSDGRQMTIDLIAPGLSEALIATAMGLIAAIPAYIFNNRFAEKTSNLITEYYNFSDSLILFLKTYKVHPLTKQVSKN